MDTLPSYDQIVTLHRKYAPHSEAFDLVFTHCEIVWDIAEQLINTSQPSVDKELVRIGCLLHDIGVYKLFLDDGSLDHKNYIQHGEHGYKILKDEGFNDVLCRFASHHTGVGLSKADIIAGKLPLAHKDFLAETPEEELVMYSDKFHTKSTPPSLMTADSYASFVARFGEDKVQKFRDMQHKYGMPNLATLADKYGLEIQ